MIVREPVEGIRVTIFRDRMIKHTALMLDATLDEVADMIIEILGATPSKMRSKVKFDKIFLCEYKDKKNGRSYTLRNYGMNPDELFQLIKERVEQIE